MLEYVCENHVFRFEPGSEKFADWEYDRWCRVVLETVGGNVRDSVGFCRSVEGSRSGVTAAGGCGSRAIVADFGERGNGGDSAVVDERSDESGACGGERGEVVRSGVSGEGGVDGRVFFVSDGGVDERGSRDLGRVDDGVAVECVGAVRSKSARKRAAQRARRAAEKLAGVSLGAGTVADEQGSCVGSVVGVESVSRVADAGAVGESCEFVRSDLECVVSVGERKQLAREWYERKRAENALATQRAKYNFKRNEYLDRARISEKKWEQERLTCEQKLAKITEARFGSKPGYAETLASISDGSELPPSLSTGANSPANLSDGTISPDSSMSVAEANRLLKKVEEVSERLVKLELENKSLRSLTVFKGGRVEEENGKFYSFDGTGQYVPPTPELGSECELYSMGDYPEYC